MTFIFCNKRKSGFEGKRDGMEKMMEEEGSNVPPMSYQSLARYIISKVMRRVPKCPSYHNPRGGGGEAGDGLGTPQKGPAANPLEPFCIGR